eukprot:2297805-Alexandrium_andersonii.AAC.1
MVTSALICDTDPGQDENPCVFADYLGASGTPNAPTCARTRKLTVLGQRASAKAEAKGEKATERQRLDHPTTPMGG